MNQCQSHAVEDSRTTVIATTHSTNPDYSGYDLCEECAGHYDLEETVYPGLPKQNILRQPKPQRRCIGCGGPAEMNASLGPSCPDCYDDLSG